MEISISEFIFRSPIALLREILSSTSRVNHTIHDGLVASVLDSYSCDAGLNLGDSKHTDRNACFVQLIPGDCFTNLYFRCGERSLNISQ